MHLLDLTLSTPAENLALDEALLDACQRGQLPPHGVLRFWESAEPIVVVGRGSRVAEDVRLDVCRARGIPILRRVSGGLSIVSGPGCLMYAVVAPQPVGTPGDINVVHQHVLSTVAQGLQSIGLPVQIAGISDLAIVSPDGGLRKVSGNSLRMSRRHFLYHGALLYNFDLPLISQLLRQPPRSPEYRAGRRHDAFVTNLGSDCQSLRRAIARAWQAKNNLQEWPQQATNDLVASRYSDGEWNLSR